MGNGHHHPTTYTRIDLTQRAELGGAQAEQRQRSAAGEPQDVALQALDAGARERAVRGGGMDGWVRGWMDGGREGVEGWVEGWSGWVDRCALLSSLGWFMSQYPTDWVGVAS